MPARIAPEEALIYAMVTASAVDRTISTDELQRIGSIVKELPPFARYDDDWLVNEAQDCGKLLARPDGLRTVLDLIRQSLPPHLYETAYVLVAEVIATDLRVVSEEIRFLDMLGGKLEIDKLVCAALERAARARHQKV
ncbi:MAG: tellurite resistance TerB family protein [Hyphomicrobium sp.]